jgi:hypothetical protein
VSLSKREKIIGVTVGAVVGLFALDRLAVSPLLAQREQLVSDISQAELKLVQATNLIRSKPLLDKQLADNISKGLTKGQSEAESQLLNHLREWAQEAGLDLGTLKPAGAPQPVVKLGGRPSEKEKAFLKLTCRASGTGNADQVAKFIYRIQTASIPLRITDLTINTRKEETDDLEVSLGVSTIFLTPEAVKAIEEKTGTTAASRPAASSRPVTTSRPTSIAPPATRPVGATPTTQTQGRS